MNLELLQEATYRKRALTTDQRLMSLTFLNPKPIPMNNPATPKPHSKKYNVEKTEDLNTPEYHSSTDRRRSHELPATENLNDQPKNKPNKKIQHEDLPKTNLGNKRKDNEKQREKIITP